MGKFLLKLELYIILALRASEKHGELIHIHNGTEKSRVSARDLAYILLISKNIPWLHLIKGQEKCWSLCHYLLFIP